MIAAVGRLADSGQGDVTRLTGERDEWRLRVGDWRVRFVQQTITRQLQPPGMGTEEIRTIEIRRVRHRREAYRD